MNASIIQKENAEVAKWIREGRTLVKHSGATPPFATKGAGALAQAEAAGLKLEGAVKRLFVREREEGWIAAGQFENVTQQGLLDELITPLTLGLAHGPGPATTKTKVNPATGQLETENVPGIVEDAEEDVPSWGEFGLKLLVNGALIAIGVVLIIAGILQAVKPRNMPLPIPIPV